MSGLPESWTHASLSDIATLVRGVTYKKEDARGSVVDDHVPLLRATNITGTSLNFDDLVFVPRRNVSDEQRLAIGDIVIASSSGSKDVVGKSGQLTTPFTGSFGAFCTAIRPVSELLPAYLGLYFQSAEYRKSISEISAGSNINNIKSSDLAIHQIPLPPRAEQTRIVETLEELLGNLDAAVADLQAAQRKLARYRQSLLKAAVEGTLTAQWRAAHGPPRETGTELLQRILQERRTRWEDKQRAKFAQAGKPPPKGWQAKYPEPAAPDTNDLPALPEGWAWASVDQVAADEAYALAIGPFGSNLVVSDYREVGVPLVFVRNIRSKNYGNGITKFVTAEKANELKAHHVAPGDVLVTKMGEPPGEADVYPSGHPSAVITADCIKIRPQQGLMDAYFLAAAINSPLGIRQVKPMTQGVAQKKVSLGRFSTFAVPIPPIEEQTQILAILDAQLSAAKEQDAALTRALHQAAAQRRNLLKAAFAGQLVPQDSADEPASALLARIRASKADNALEGKRKPKVGRRR